LPTGERCVTKLRLGLGLWLCPLGGSTSIAVSGRPGELACSRRWNGDIAVGSARTGDETGVEKGGVGPARASTAAPSAAAAPASPANAARRHALRYNRSTDLVKTVASPVNHNGK
jgi:hypothetical protein